MKKAIIKDGYLYVPSSIMLAPVLFLEWLSVNKTLGVVDVSYEREKQRFRVCFQYGNQRKLEDAAAYINNNL
jgi:hypothetical protein